ncbi:NAD-dependent epimerase/dehydratase family protein [Luteimonas sp. BDR2-5]|uniref:NAD-dependent epimerase/dehydratase family protein n=1 Tax=Proluteimonas luteida TaxID=2878685 RepID=UPI001E294C57|nr:NAD-dependent epimerase/dehydratase family protein [Luteimonas sp. BDR2-5]MCD9027150.1 NAD-dependent epimerase/dehydratase family protein [Luteimonas sp. BDR2-5]
MRVLLVGATGLVGRHVLAGLLADPRIDAVVAPTRRPLTTPHPKLRNPVVDFDALPDAADWWAVDAVICTLGTTIRDAGSQAAFRRVDFDYPLQVAQLALRHGARIYALNSAAGADAGSRIFYSRVKGELETALEGLGFASLLLVRPGLIGGRRDSFRLGERVATVALRVLGPVLPRRLRINPAGRIAQALIDGVVDARPGCRVVTSDALV